MKINYFHNMIIMLQSILTESKFYMNKLILRNSKSFYTKNKKIDRKPELSK